MNKPIVVLGSINLDLVATAERIPAVGETVRGKQFHTFFGGKGANQAVAIARLGYPVRMIGRVGNDGFGLELRDALEKDAVDVTAVEVAEGSSGVALIATSERAENSIIVVPGANGTVNPQTVDKYLNLIGSAAAVLTQLEIPLQAVEHLAEITDAARVPLILDPAPAQPLTTNLLRRVDWLTPNESEAGTLLGEVIKPGDELSAAEKLLSLGARNVVVKCGERGAFLAERNGHRSWIPTYKVKAIDTTAAGDAFNGAFAVALAQGKTIEEGARFAAAAAALSVTRRGAQPSLPTLAEVQQFLRDAVVGNGSAGAGA